MKIIYIDAMEAVTVTEPEIKLSDVATIKSSDEKLEYLVNEIRLQCLSKQNKQTIISVTEVIDAIHKGWPDVLVVNLDATNIVVKYEPAENKKKKKILNVIKIICVSILCFFGAAFTIMAYENDVGTPAIFANVYLLITGRQSDGSTILELSYSVGLMVGIIFFFHHFGKRKNTTDPTPVEVSIKKYEQDSNMVMNEIYQRTQKKGDQDA